MEETKKTTEKVEKAEKVEQKEELVIVDGMVEDVTEPNPPSSLQEYQGAVIAMCPPFQADNDVPNNAWMEDEYEASDREKHMNEWMRLYKDLSSLALVYLPPCGKGLRDQIYISNAAMVFPHKQGEALIANFIAKGRPGETPVTEQFLKSLGYKTKVCPHIFEGSADIKPLFYGKGEVVYVSGYGIRTEIAAHRWIEKEYDCKVISYEQKDAMAYHLDCVVEPVDYANTVVATKGVDPKTIKEIEKYTNIIPLEDQALVQAGATNFFRCGNYLFIGSDINDLKGDPYYAEDYELEKKKLAFVEKVANSCGLEVNAYNLGEDLKQGACCSCNILDMNYWDFKKNFEMYYKY